MNINWFPGHMAKTRRQIKESLKMVDAIIEIRDARIVSSSKNPDIEDICGNKPRIILLNKKDLAEDKVTKKWINSLSQDNIKVLAVNSVTGEGLNKIKPTLNELLKEKHERMKNKGLVKIVDRVMVVGIPNVGKSSFINKMAKNSIAKVGDRPGVTKSKQWIKTKIDIELMDTPGVLWPKLDSEIVQLNLAFTGAIKDEIMDIETLALRLVERLQVKYPERLMKRYKLEALEENPLDNLDNIGRRRGALISKGEIDYNRISVILLDEFRGGKLGAISLEDPEDIIKDNIQIEE
ncbi:ribosome biogenesis GTPase YlqF [Clostridium botulinum]|uniref:Ribosome biogenesis GTPase A n=2 Tax=Clostridium botulinum TaxID=1491 RepID=A0A846I0M8_CLOBO|nr:ribosome biogenesis GTPase YlqF [Clostridium botulinum]AJD25670.1 ribosome biogenesis GTP-binding protein YlqF [Clostridium botulinum CDC_297]ACQ53039.1 GTP-binding protein [Clostridium botulinum Ba4 str. 657]AJE10915.1 ribosome biogenesis GTP-binding protein YlqF [Clostridium botulinum CDC_1436]APU61383.1 ribosome biogenesis GTP-binding protein YlqF [Clostridium botulinum]AXG93957.1 ribosome biogenesis GTPase YlqF [Clostridium botulinum]